MNYQSEQIDKLIAALSKAQGEMMAASKDSSNPFFNSKYADLSSVWNACREPLSKNELAVTQTMCQIDGNLMLVTTLGHSSGQFIKSELPIEYSKTETEVNKYGKEVKANLLHRMGSCVTYLRRYALSSIVGVAPDDDDGNIGGQAQEPQKKVVVSEKQAIELIDMLTNCDTKFRDDIFTKINKAPINAKSLYDITPEIYERLKIYISDHLSNKQEKVLVNENA
jgi:hypothetical protein